MSLFCITDSYISASKIKDDYDKIFPNTSAIYELSDNIYLTITSGFKKDFHYKKIGSNYIFLCGTIFTKNGFNQTVLDSIIDPAQFTESLKSDSQNVFGHYIIIIYNSAQNSLSIYTDRVGCLNVYYASFSAQSYIISNDLTETSIISGFSELEVQAVGEFLMTESNVNSLTFFKGIKRLSLGNKLLLVHNNVTEQPFYQYTITRLNMAAYLERINTYFDALNSYPGKISVDLSGGYDTRLITSIAYKKLRSFSAFSICNRFDNGIDYELSSAISSILDISCHYLDYSNYTNISEQYPLIYHSTSLLRDAKRSQRMPLLFSNKFSHCGLSLGGYGGEILRAKYNTYPNVKHFIRYYYKSFEAEKICKLNNYHLTLQTELNNYLIPQYLCSDLLQNWYYAVAKMRIWGSAYLQMGSLYGDIIHPFMDWYLMGPIFGFSVSDLSHGKLQKNIIETYAPSLKGLPINQHLNALPRKLNKNDIFEKILSINNWNFRHYFQYVRLKSCYLRERKSTHKSNYSIIPVTNELDYNKLLYQCGISTSQRFYHILCAKKYIDTH